MGLPKKLKDQWWGHVRKCLVKFHDMTVREAQVKAYRLRLRMQKPFPGSPKGVGDIQYHAEPFDVACRIAGRDIRVGTDMPLKDYHEKYLFEICGYEVHEEYKRYEE